MSFGQAASRRGIRPAPNASCPCGGGTFGACCGPILDGVPAPTAEALMRSRYTAFAVGDVPHLLETWHPRTRPASLQLDDATTWRGLEIIALQAGAVGDTRGIVEFRARWTDRTVERGTLHEVSRFRFAAGRWYYIDGAIDA